MSETYKHQLKLKASLPDTTTWVRIEQDGRLVVEFYDFSSQADDAFGNDVAYLLIVAPENKPLVQSKLEADDSSSDGDPDPDLRLLKLLQQRFDSYFQIQEWFKANGIPYEKEFDDWA